jgi:hypothetical protein
MSTGRAADQRRYADEDTYGNHVLDRSRGFLFSGIGSNGNARCPYSNIYANIDGLRTSSDSSSSEQRAAFVQPG